MDIARIIQAICYGKSRKEVYNLLSPEEKDKLISLQTEKIVELLKGKYKRILNKVLTFSTTGVFFGVFSQIFSGLMKILHYPHFHRKEFYISLLLVDF